MNMWLWSALAMLLAYVPTGIATFQGDPADRLVALEYAGVLTILEMVLLTEGFNRGIYYDLPLTLAFLCFGSGMVFARFLQRWL